MPYRRSHPGSTHRTVRMNFSNTCIQIILALGYLASVSGNATENDFFNLYEDLLGNYSRQIRPLRNQSDAMTVSLQFDLLSVSDIDDVKQRISVLAVVSVQWTDKNLVWDPSIHGGIDRMYFDEDQIWAPSVYIEESQSKGPTLFNLPTTHLVLPDGTVTFISSGTLETSCSLDMTYFPCDYQSCKFGFGVLDASKKDVTIESDPRGPQKSENYLEDGEWRVLGFGTEIRYYGQPNYEFQTLHVILKLQRRSTYYVLNVIVPAVTVSLLSLISFAVPVESGERLAYTLTNLLSLAVYITYIGSIMPSSSVDLPIILRYLVSLFLLSSMCVVMTVVVITVRWSKVIFNNDQFKSIFIFGFPVRFKRKKKFCRLYKQRSTHKTCLEKVQSMSTESPSLCSSELQSLCETPKENVTLAETVNTRDPAKPQNRPNVPTTFVNNNIQQADFAPKNFPKIDDVPRALEDSSQEINVINTDVDPDIVYVCACIDLGSFCILFISFLLMSTQSFIELNTQLTV